MTKTKLKALERIYAAEIENRLPLQSRARVFRELYEDDMVHIDCVQRGRAIVSGWCLTHAGRLAYCSAQKAAP